MSMLCLGKRRSSIFITFVFLTILVFTINHFVSTNVSKQGLLFAEHQELGNAKSLKESENVVKSIPYSTRYVPGHRMVHLDLKGAPPKLSYILSILPLIREAGGTALLIEYEDMFPFWGPLRNISARNSYSTDDLRKIQASAAKNNLTVIPLVQTFGHLEFLLKLDEFKHLREVPIYPQAICPSHNESWIIIEQIIDQVLSLHPASKWIHIGCDEVFQLGQCSKCAERITNSNVNNDPFSVSIQTGKGLYLEHVHRVASYVRTSQKRIPIIWDDMLRSIESKIIIDSGIGSLVEPMIWVYTEDVDRFVDSLKWSTYGKIFKNVWAASAFKGAFGERLFTVNLQRHVANNLSWLEVMSRETRGTRKISFRGIALTGWSRYDHFAVLCELLPVAFPSLILNLAILARGKHDFEAIRRSHQILQCGTQKAFMTPDELRRNSIQWDLHLCKYPGSHLMSLLYTFNINKRDIELAWEKVNSKEGWLTQYNVDHKFSSPYRVHEAMKSISHLPSSLESSKSRIERELSLYFDSYTVKEWSEQNILPLVKTSMEIDMRAKMLASPVSWPRRPFGFIA